MSYTLIIYDPHRAALFRAALGTDEVQVTTLNPFTITYAQPGIHLAYKLDLEALTSDQIQALAQLGAAESGRPVDEVHALIQTEGFFILAAGTAIRAIDRPGFTLDAVFPRIGTGGG